MKPGKVRPIAVCPFRRGGRILVSTGYDRVKNQAFYRPLGGKIEFGETGAATIRREIREEIGREVANIRFLGALENIFIYNGQPGHEIVLVYDGEFADPAVYSLAEIRGGEADGEALHAVWKRLDEFNPAAPLYPDGLLEMLKEKP